MLQTERKIMASVKVVSGDGGPAVARTQMHILLPLKVYLDN